MHNKRQPMARTVCLFFRLASLTISSLLWACEQANWSYCLLGLISFISSAINWSPTILLTILSFNFITRNVQLRRADYLLRFESRTFFSFHSWSANISHLRAKYAFSNEKKKLRRKLFKLIQHWVSDIIKKTAWLVEEKNYLENSFSVREVHKFSERISCFSLSDHPMCNIWL